MTQVPTGPSHLWCPLWRKRQSAVCHTCPLWVQMRGMDRNTGKEIDQWQCSLSFLPALLVEVAQQSRETGAAVESFRNQMTGQSAAAQKLVEAIALRALTPVEEGPPQPLAIKDDSDGAR